MDDENKTQLIGLTSDVVAAFVANNKISTSELTDIVKNVHAAFVAAAGGSAPAPEVVQQTPAVSIKKSITPDFLICLEDGRQFKSLKRHLRTKYGISPEEYRAKWGLPKTYPMVAPSYAASRSELAKKMGLGSGGRKPASPAPKAAMVKPVARKAKARAS